MGMILLIVNPVAGKLRARTALMDVVEVFSAAGLDVNVKLTQARGDARGFARAAKRDVYDRIVCVGGDGTLNETITGAMESGENIALGYVPLGSTNDFAASLGLSKDVGAAAQAALSGEPHLLDVGDFGGLRNFAYIASFGAFTSTSYSTPQYIKNTFGHLAYLLEGVKDIVNIKAYHMSVEADGQRCEGDYIFGAVANSTSIGGIVKLNSAIVDMSDGLFEMCLMKKPMNPNELTMVLTSIMNSDYENRMFDFIHASEIKFTADEPIAWSLDGEEAMGGNEIVIRNVHNAITFCK